MNVERSGASGSSASGSSASGRGGAHAPSEHTSLLEWVVAAIGLVLVVSAVWVMLAEARRERTPPDIAVRADSVHALPGGGFLVRFTAHNRGRETAAEVEIVGELRDAAGTATSRVRLDYLPGESRRGGGLLFARDPGTGTLVLRAEGYREP